MKINTIKPNKDNPRKIDAAALQRLKSSVTDFPKMMRLRPIIIDQNGVILGGNMRFKALKEMGYTEIPDEWVKVASELTPDEKRRFIITDNVSGGEWDWEELEASWEGEELENWGLDLPDSWGDQGAGTEGLTDPDEVPEDVDTCTQLGDVWALGDHRLHCGDSTDARDVARLMDGALADLVFTDPPYGVNIKGGKHKGNYIAGDLTQTAIPFSFEICVKHATAEKAVFYFCGAETNLGLYQKLFDRYLHMLPKHLIWVKNGFVMKQNGYHNQFEILFHGYKPGSGSLWYGGRKEHEASDVWQVSRDASAEYKHPTQKPTALAQRAILNSSPAGGVVFDPFLGSGSTLIACEQSGRKCYGMELDPHYCDVIIKRWEDFTGQKAEKINE